MINIITKDYFKKNIKETEGYTIKYCPLEFKLNDSSLNLEKFEKIISDSGNDLIIYLKVGELFLMYYPNNKFIIIPPSYNPDFVLQSILEDPNIYFNNWSFIMLSDENKYILNEFSRAGAPVTIIDYNSEKEMADFGGQWRIIDNISGESIDFELRCSEYSWRANKNTTDHRITYEEKVKIPVEINGILEKDNYLEILINGCKNYQRINFKSKSDS